MSKPKNCKCKGMVLAQVGACPLHSAAPDLADVLEKIVAWLDRLANHADAKNYRSAEGLARDTRFPALAEVNATAADCRKALKKADRT